MIDGVGLQEDENTKKRREILARRPSYRKILNELGGCEISGIFRVTRLFFFFELLYKFFNLKRAFEILQKTKGIHPVDWIQTVAVRHLLLHPAIEQALLYLCRALIINPLPV